MLFFRSPKQLGYLEEIFDCCPSSFGDMSLRLGPEGGIHRIVFLQKSKAALALGYLEEFFELLPLILRGMSLRLGPEGGIQELFFRSPKQLWPWVT